jgi:folate-binding protein YgfZ
MEQGAKAGRFVDLSASVKLRVAGDDRVRFVNGQITADIRGATDSNAIEACLLDSKGRLSAHVFIFAASDSFFVEADPALKEALPARLDRYLIADDVRIEDVSDQWSIFHVMADSAPVIEQAQWILSARRFGETGWDIWIARSDREKVFAQLSLTFSFCDSLCFENFRIERGIPGWGKELTTEINPIEANLEDSAIDYEKGCYLGQEVISRMKMSGQRNKKLCGLVSTNDSPLKPGMRLVELSGVGKEVGWITSGLRSEKLNKEVALGFLKRGFNAVGTRLEARSTNEGCSEVVPVEVVDLPLAE